MTTLKFAGAALAVAIALSSTAVSAHGPKRSLHRSANPPIAMDGPTASQLSGATTMGGGGEAGGTGVGGG